MTEKALFNENLTAQYGLAHVIRTRLLGVDPDEQDVQLDDGDWQTILDLLTELDRMVEHFTVFANDHSMEASTETWAALYCAKAVLSKAAGAQP